MFGLWEELDEVAIWLAHFGIVILHVIEFWHVNIITVGVLISLIWGVESVFEVRKGVRKYIKKRKYGSITKSRKHPEPGHV